MIRISDLYFSYTGTAPYVLENLSLTIEDGTYVSVLGDNGAGKSTLIRLLLRFIKPTRGHIAIDAKRVGYVPQKTDSLNVQFPITVSEMLGAYRRLLHVKDRDAVAECLRLVRMEDYRNALIGTLSGGQRQRVFIARALMGSPQLLILDEPSTGVDRGSAKEIYALIRGLNRENGITVMSVEHNLEAAIENSTQIYHLSGGNGHLCSPELYIEEYVHANRGGEDHV